MSYTKNFIIVENGAINPLFDTQVEKYLTMVELLESDPNIKITNASVQYSLEIELVGSKEKLDEDFWIRVANGEKFK